MGGGQGGAEEEVNAIERDALVDELSSTWLDSLDGADREAGRRLLEAIVDDWAAEARGTPNPDDVLRFQRKDLDAAGARLGPADRLAVLRRRVLGRRVELLNARSHELGRAVVGEKVGDKRARRDGRALLDEAAGLARELRELPTSPELAPIRRELEEAMLDALYAVERKAMSSRLARSVKP